MQFRLSKEKGLIGYIITGYTWDIEVRLLSTHVHAREILNASKFSLFNIYVNECKLKYAEN